MRFGAIFFVAVLTSLSACKSPYADDRSQTLGAPGGAGQDEIISHGRIEPTREIRIEIDELSGIDNIVDPETGKITIISVGDSDFKIFFHYCPVNLRIKSAGYRYCSPEFVWDSSQTLRL